MPPKFDPNATREVTIKHKIGKGVTGPLAAIVGPMGFSPKKVAEEIDKVGSEFRSGERICVRMFVTGRSYRMVLEPTAPMLLIRALNEPEREGGGHRGNVSLEDLYQIARVLRPKSLAATFEGTIKEILGTAKSIVGITVNEQDPIEVIRSIELGELTVPKE
jgi:large subunit ribosomal protein L12e